MTQTQNHTQTPHDYPGLFAPDLSPEMPVVSRYLWHPNELIFGRRLIDHILRCVGGAGAHRGQAAELFQSATEASLARLLAGSGIDPLRWFPIMGREAAKYRVRPGTIPLALLEGQVAERLSEGVAGYRYCESPARSVSRVELAEIARIMMRLLLEEMAVGRDEKSLPTAYFTGERTAADVKRRLGVALTRHKIEAARKWFADVGAFEFSVVRRDGRSWATSTYRVGPRPLLVPVAAAVAAGFPVGVASADVGVGFGAARTSVEAATVGVVVGLEPWVAGQPPIISTIPVEVATVEWVKRQVEGVARRRVPDDAPALDASPE